MVKQLTANQNPSSFDKLKHLKLLTTKLQRAYNKENVIVRWCGQ